MWELVSSGGLQMSKGNHVRQIHKVSILLEHDKTMCHLFGWMNEMGSSASGGFTWPLHMPATSLVTFTVLLGMIRSGWTVKRVSPLMHVFGIQGKEGALEELFNLFNLTSLK